MAISPILDSLTTTLLLIIQKKSENLTWDREAFDRYRILNGNHVPRFFSVKKIITFICNLFSKKNSLYLKMHTVFDFVLPLFTNTTKLPQVQ